MLNSEPLGWTEDRSMNRRFIDLTALGDRYQTTARSADYLEVRSLFCSRMLLSPGSVNFLAYFHCRRGTRSMLVDVLGTGHSPAHFVGTNEKKQNNGVYREVPPDLTCAVHARSFTRGDP
jgi:hypothetical protein